MKSWRIQLSLKFSKALTSGVVHIEYTYIWVHYSNGEGLNKIPILLCDCPVDFGKITLPTLKIVCDTTRVGNHFQQSKT